MDKPRYTHDCYVCSFLGQYKEYDLYFCSRMSLIDTTVIARFSNEEGDYASGLTFGVTGGNIGDNTNVSKLKVALYRALLFPEFKQRIIEYFETYEKDFPERRKRFKELLLISGTNPKDYPTLIDSLSDFGLTFIEEHFKGEE